MADEKANTKIRIGHYILGQTLGQGSFGKVKLAEHEITGHKVAVKMINRQKIQHKQMDKKIRREIRILKLLRHPHIIRLYEVIETASDIFLIMEYVGGGELFDYIVKHGRFSNNAARRFFQQIICGVEHIHHYRVVHRDLKPENLLLDDEANVKIADFGLSNLMADGDFLQTSCGSPNYAAPEVISGKLYAGPEVDVWSCGVILYALLCGRLPFDEESVPALFKKIKEGQYVIPQHIPPPCKQLISSMLVVDPLKRITIAQIREHPWFKESLPAYLALPPSAEPQGEEKVDMELLRTILTKMDIPLDIGLKALASGTKNDISVAYHILLDAKSRHQQQQQQARALYSPRKQPITSNEANPAKLRAAPIMEDIIQSRQRDLEIQARCSYNEPTSSMLRIGSPEGGGPGTWSSRLSVSPLHGISPLGQSESLRAPVPNFGGISSSSPMAIAGGLPRTSGVSPRAASSAMERHLRYPGAVNPDAWEAHDLHENWRLGLFSELASNAVMGHIYRVLKLLNMKWKVISPYRLLVLKPSTPKSKAIFIGVQLYRMQERHDKGYFIDLTIMGPDIFPAIDIVHDIYCAVSRSVTMRLTSPPQI